jgi:hypothetical protein
MKAHDLDAILADVLAPIEPKPEVHITWAPHTELADGEHWAQWRKYSELGHWIGIWVGLQKAPAYVVRYLVAHEVLHVLLPPRKGCAHHRGFRVAERMVPQYARATAWLERHAK